MRIPLPLALLLLVAGCATPRVAPPPATAPAVAPTPPQAPLAADWRDWPIAPGTWAYVANGSRASFGTSGAAPLATLACDRPGGAVTLTLAGVVPGPLTVRTSALTRVVTATPVADGAELRLAATDPLLDAMAFSRGRFAVSATAGSPVVLPAWAEVGRVIEDCRR